MCVVVGFENEAENARGEIKEARVSKTAHLACNLKDGMGWDGTGRDGTGGGKGEQNLVSVAWGVVVQLT